MNKCRYISEYHQNIILQHCNSIHFKYTPQTTILFRELPRSPEHLGRPVAVRGWAASWPHNVHFMSLEPWSHAGAGDNFHWLLTEWAAPQLHTPLGVQRWPPQTSSPPGHRWALSLTGDAGTIRDRALEILDKAQRRFSLHEWRSSEERQNQGLQEYCFSDYGSCCQL